MDDNSDDGKPEDDGPPIVRPPDDAPSPLGM
jgi:hypothetical protein